MTEADKHNKCQHNKNGSNFTNMEADKTEHTLIYMQLYHNEISQCFYLQSHSCASGFNKEHISTNKTK